MSIHIPFAKIFMVLLLSYHVFCVYKFLNLRKILSKKNNGQKYSPAPMDRILIDKPSFKAEMDQWRRRGVVTMVAVGFMYL